MSVIHRDPAPEQSGGGTESAAPKLAQIEPGIRTVVAPEPKPAEPPKIALSVEEYQRLTQSQARLAEIEAEKRQLAEAKEQERLKALAEKGEIEKALTTLRESKDVEIRKAIEKADALETQILGGEKRTVITSGMFGADFRSDAAAAQVRQLLEPQFESVRDAAGQIVVRDKATLRPAADVIRERLASPDFAHFLKPSTTGGAGSRGGERTTATGAATEPADVNEALIQMLRDKHTRKDTSYYGLTKITN
jgi:hypothetical protein